MDPQKQKHHHVFRLITLIVLLVVAIIVSTVLSSLQFRKTVKIDPEPSPIQVNKITTRPNSEILKEMSTVNQAKPLTEKESTTLLKLMKANAQPLTDAQRAEILSAMKASQK